MRLGGSLSSTYEDSYEDEAYGAYGEVGKVGTGQAGEALVGLI